MSRHLRSRGSRPHREQPRRRPLYARVLRLRHLHPGALLCFVLFEGMIALGGLLALTELVNYWVAFVLPVTVAAMVKFNDVVAGALARPPRGAVGPQPGTEGVDRVAVGRASLARTDRHGEALGGRVRAGKDRAGEVKAGEDRAGEDTDPGGSPVQRARQSAARRYG